MFCVKKSWIISQFILFNMWSHQAGNLETNSLTPCLLRTLCIIQCLTPPFDLVTLQKDAAYLTCFGRSGVCYCVWWKDNQKFPTLHLSVMVCCLYVLSESLSYTLFLRWRRQIQTRQKSVWDQRNRVSRVFLPGTRSYSCVKAVYTHQLQCETNLTIWHVSRGALSILDFVSYLTCSWNKHGS
jgi:hypothetical protein